MKAQPFTINQEVIANRHGIKATGTIIRHKQNENGQDWQVQHHHPRALIWYKESQITPIEPHA